MKARSMNTQKGNVLFLILIAVALFAALSFAISNTTRGPGTNDRWEAHKSNAAAMIQYASSIRSAIQRMQMINQVPTNRIDFYNTNAILENGSPGATYDNTLCS